MRETLVGLVALSTWLGIGVGIQVVFQLTFRRDLGERTRKQKWREVDWGEAFVVGCLISVLISAALALAYVVGRGILNVPH